MSSGGESSFAIRPFGTLAEYQACVALQEEVWGEGFSERVPVAILKVSQRLGGVASGAYGPDGRLAGFVFGMTGIEGETPVHWSDMLAVRPGLRDSGLGRRLKLHQRALLLERGVRRVYWTFDPLESRNAHLNLERLGVVCREYVEDMYGESDSPLHQGIGTDRLVALWELDSPRVRHRLGEEEAGHGGPTGQAEPALEGVPRTPRLEAELPSGSGSHPAPQTPRFDLEAPSVTVSIPAHIQRLRRHDPELAREWRRATRAVLVHYLERGWEVRGLKRAGNLSHYRLVREEGGTSSSR